MPSPVSAPGGGGPPFDPNNRYVLRIDSTYQQHVKHGYPWPNGPLALGNMLWGGWVKPLGQGIIFIDGYGGAHVACMTLAALPGPISGNIWDGSASVSFAGTYQIAVGEWCYLAIRARVEPGFQKLWSYVNGICDSEVALTGRSALPWSGGNGLLGVGGLDHQNGHFDIACLEGYDRDNDPIGTLPALAFVPNRFPNLTDRASSGFPPGTIADFRCDYTRPGVLHDISARGCAGETYPDRTFHHGTLFGNGGTVTDTDGFQGWAGTAGGFAVPQWVLDPNCPFKAPYGSPLPAETIPSPGGVPGGARCFDSFGRRNQTFAFQATPSLGSTEGGSQGPLAWQAGVIVGYAVQPGRGGALWGILQGSAVFLDGCPAAAWVDTGSATQDIRVTRATPAGNNGETGVSFRLVDKDNYWFAYYTPLLGGIRVGFWTNGGIGGFTSVLTTDPGTTGWTTLRVTASGNTIKVYTDDGVGGWTQRGGDITNATYNTATRAGLATPDINVGNSLTRYKNWTAM